MSKKSNNKAASNNNDLDRLIDLYNTTKKEIEALEKNSGEIESALLIPAKKDLLISLDKLISEKQDESILLSLKSKMLEIMESTKLVYPTNFVIRIDDQGIVNVERAGKIKASGSSGSRTKRSYNSTATKDDIRILADTICPIMGYSNASKMCKLHVKACLAVMGKTTAPEVGSLIGYLNSKQIKNSPLWGNLGDGKKLGSVGKDLAAKSSVKKDVDLAVKKFAELFDDQIVKHGIAKNGDKINKNHIAEFLFKIEDLAPKADAKPI